MALVDLHLLDGEAPVGVDPDRVITWPARVLLLLLLALTALYGLRLFLLPLPVGAIAPPAEFSASRAARQVEAIAAAPAGIESTLASSLASLGLEVEPVPAQSRGVAARLRGTRPYGTILLVTPYDPAGSAPGLSGAATMLEAFRALATGPKPKNDILVLFSATRPLDEAVLAAFDAALVLRFERISDRGPVALLATTAGSGRLVREALRGLPHPTVTLAANDLGLRPVSRAATLCFAAIGGPSTVAAGPDLRTIQDAGETALDLLRRFGSQSLPVPPGPDVVAFTVGQDQVVTYPARWSRSLGLLTAAAAVVLLAIGFLQKKLDLRLFATGLLFHPLVAFVAWAAAFFFLSLLFRLNPGGRLLPWGALHAEWFAGAVLALSVALAALLVTLLRGWRKRPTADPELAAAGLAWWALFALVAGLRYPDLALIVAVTPLLLIPAFLVLFFTENVSRHPWLGGTALALAGVPTVLLLAPACRLLDVVAGWMAPAPRLSVAAVSAGLSALVVALFLPHLSLPRRRWLFPAFFLVVAAGLLVAGVRF